MRWAKALPKNYLSRMELRKRIPLLLGNMFKPVTPSKPTGATPPNLACVKTPAKYPSHLLPDFIRSIVCPKLKSPARPNR